MASKLLFCFAQHSFMLFNGLGEEKCMLGEGPKAPPRWPHQGGRSFQCNCWEEPSFGWCPGPWAGVSPALSSSPTTALGGLPDPPAHLTHPPPPATHTHQHVPAQCEASNSCRCLSQTGGNTLNSASHKAPSSSHATFRGFCLSWAFPNHSCLNRACPHQHSLLL